MATHCRARSPKRVKELKARISSNTEYSLAGLRIVSEVPLPPVMLSRNGASKQEEIAVQYGQVPTDLPSAQTFPDAQVRGEELLLDIPDVARFLVRGGRQIVIEAAPCADEGDISAWLLGTVFAALCHQRGIVPLHGSAIDIPGGCAVFVGASGAGKSTLAAALAARGHQVISDDVCFLRRDDSGNIKVWPGIGRIRLWPDALKGLGYDGSGIERELRGYNKFLVPVKAPEQPLAPRRLRGVYQLEVAATGEAASVTRLNGAATIELLMPNVYRLTLAEYMGGKPAIFALCTAIANEVPVYRFRREVGFEALPRTVERLEAHLFNAS